MQYSLFGGTQPLKIDKPIRLIELFAGIGAQAAALRNLGADFEHYCICEFDRFAVQSYNAIHGTNFEPSDITKISSSDLVITETDKYCYILTYSFPCTDLSCAGARKGMARDSGTRSGLLWEVERLLKETENLPQVLLMENVPQFMKAQGWADWIAFLDGLGYKSYWQVINAKHFGIPQNRERCFMVSLLGDYFYDFPRRVELKKGLEDFLEEEPVDRKYYLTSEQIKQIKNSPYNIQRGRLEPCKSGGGYDNIESTNSPRRERCAVCKTIRSGGKASFDRHSWDLVVRKHK